MTDENETAYIGVDPVVHRANETEMPLNTAAEMRDLEDRGVIDKAEDEAVDGEATLAESDERTEDDDDSDDDSDDDDSDDDDENETNELGIPVNDDGSLQVSVPAENSANDGSGEVSGDLFSSDLK